MNTTKRGLIVSSLCGFLFGLLAMTLHVNGFVMAETEKPKDDPSITEELSDIKDEKDDGSTHNFPATAIEYAKMVEPDLGVPPRVDLGEGVEVLTYVDGVPVRGTTPREDCDNPTQIAGDCISGSRLQRYEGRTANGDPLPDVVWVSFGRHNNAISPDTFLGSVQMVGYNMETGATAFFESSDAIMPWAYTDPETNRLMGVMPWIDEPEEFNKAYKTPGKVQCVSCHQNDPFIHSSFVDSAKMPGTDEPVIPEIIAKGREIEFDLPYYVIGGETWDMRTIHIEGNKCLKCHRVGMSTIDLYTFHDIGSWNPNDHMPPSNPGSLSEDLQELLDCWENGPENTPGCDWVIPPTADDLGRIVGDEYPYKASFNKAGVLTFR